MTPDLITSLQASTLLGIDRSTLSRWVADGRIKPAWQSPTANGARLFHRRDVERLVHETRGGPATVQITAVPVDGSAPDDTDPPWDVPAPSSNQ